MSYRTAKTARDLTSTRLSAQVSLCDSRVLVRSLACARDDTYWTGVRALPCFTPRLPHERPPLASRERVPHAHFHESRRSTAGHSVRRSAVARSLFRLSLCQLQSLYDGKSSRHRRTSDVGRSGGMGDLPAHTFRHRARFGWSGARHSGRLPFAACRTFGGYIQP